MTALTGEDEDPSLKHCWEEGRSIPLVNAATAADLLRGLGHPRFGLSREEAAQAAECCLRHCM